MKTCVVRGCNATGTHTVSFEFYPCAAEAPGWRGGPSVFATDVVLCGPHTDDEKAKASREEGLLPFFRQEIERECDRLKFIPPGRIVFVPQAIA